MPRSKAFGQLIALLISVAAGGSVVNSVAAHDVYGPGGHGPRLLIMPLPLPAGGSNRLRIVERAPIGGMAAAAAPLELLANAGGGRRERGSPLSATAFDPFKDRVKVR